MKKLKKNTLSKLTLENKESLEEILVNWNKEIFRDIVKKILDDWWDINDAIRNTKELNLIFNQTFLELLVETIKKRTQRDIKYVHILIQLIEENIISQEEHKMFFLDLAFNTKGFFEFDYNKLRAFISITELLSVEKEEWYKKRMEEAFDYLLRQFKWNPEKESIMLMIEKQLIDKDKNKEKIEKIINEVFLNEYTILRLRNVWNSSSNRDFFIFLLKKWYIDKTKYKREINKLLKKSKKEADNIDYFKSLISLLEYKEEDKDNKWFIESIKINKYKKHAINTWLKHYSDDIFFDTLINSWLIDKTKYKKEIDNLANLFIEWKELYKIKRFILLEEKWYIDKEHYKEKIDKLIKRIDKEHDYSKYTSYWKYLLQSNLIDKLKHKKEIDNLINTVKEKYAHPDSTDILLILIKNGLITPKRDKLFIEKLSNTLKNNIWHNIQWTDDRTTEYNSYYNQSPKKNIELFKILLKKWYIKTKNTPEKYGENFNLIKEISLNFNKSVYIFNFIKEKIFDIEHLKEIKKFIDNWFVINKEIFEENIKPITTHPKWLLWGYFILLVKNEINLENYPINTKNFTNFMEDNEIIFGFKKMKWENKVTPWSKEWFEEKADNKRFLEPENIKILKQFWLIPDFKVNADYSNKAIFRFSKNNPDKFEALYDFIQKKVIPSRDAIKIFRESQISSSKNFDLIFKYYLENKQKSIIPFFQKLDFIKEYNIHLDINFIKTLNDFINKDWEIDYEKLKENFKKILKLNRERKISKKINQFNNLKNNNNQAWLEKLLTENLIQYVDILYKKKLKIKIISNMKRILWKNKVNFSKIDNQKFNNPLFIEAYKMMKWTTYNKEQITKLLYDYLTWKFDNPSELNQYKTEKNQEWISKKLNKKQKDIWLSKNRKIVEINNENKNNSELNINIKTEIENKLEISEKKIKEINNLWFKFKIDFKKAWECVNYFRKEISPKENEIKSKEQDHNLFEDLKLQIESIEKSFKNRKSKKTEFITIERELNPLASLMMGNWVDWSCLNFYSPVWNYYSSIANTIDVNKWVYYIKDDKWWILARVLLTIDEDIKLTRFKMYTSWNTDINLNKYFDKYLLDIAKKWWFKINWKQDKVKLIESEAWYKDWEYWVTT